MKNNGNELFYTAINTLIFCFSVTTLILLFLLVGNLMTTKTQVTRNRTTLYVVEPETLVRDTPVEVYMGRKDYSPMSGDSYSTPSTLTGNTYVITENDEIVTAASVFTELMSLPDTVSTVYVNGAAYNTSDIDKWIKKGKTYKIYDIVDAGNKNMTYKRIYIFNNSTDRIVTGIRYQINTDVKASG